LTRRAFPKTCIQSTGTGTEDCLYLNIWAPEWPSQKPKPVMIWFHGGGNIDGGTDTPLYYGASLAAHGVVVVTAQYRLGIFGFFAHRELTRESPRHASGNYALLDQIAALRWVRDNIASFGGDPNVITIFGESAGAEDVGCCSYRRSRRGCSTAPSLRAGPCGASIPRSMSRSEPARTRPKRSTRLIGIRSPSSARHRRRRLWPRVLASRHADGLSSTGTC
jgi:para-nitrobenzyl esterase